MFGIENASKLPSGMWRANSSCIHSILSMQVWKLDVPRPVILTLWDKKRCLSGSLVLIVLFRYKCESNIGCEAHWNVLIGGKSFWVIIPWMLKTNSSLSVCSTAGATMIFHCLPLPPSWTTRKLSVYFLVSYVHMLIVALNTHLRKVCKLRCVIKTAVCRYWLKSFCCPIYQC